MNKSYKKPLVEDIIEELNKYQKKTSNSKNIFIENEETKKVSKEMKDKLSIHPSLYRKRFIL